MSELTLVLGPAWSRFSKRIVSADDITAADRLPLLLEFEDCQVDNIDDLFDILQLLRVQKNTCVIRGRLKPGVEQPCRRLTEDRPDAAATIDDVPRAWMLVDLDSADEPAGVDFTAEPAKCAEYMRAMLPLEFRTAACVWRASGSAGFKPGIRLHLWFLLSRELDGDQCRAWLSHAAVKTDRTVYGAIQPHYTADPEFVGKLDDPMSARIGKLPGTSVVPVPDTIPEDLKLAAKRSVGKLVDDRTLDPFVRAGLKKWEAANPWVEPGLSDRFECPACGSSDGCAMLPDGKLFCHGDKHANHAPNVGHPANNGFVMTRFEAFECVPWTDVIPRLQALGFFPGSPSSAMLSREQTAKVDAAVEAMTATVVGDIDLGKAKRARRELKEASEHVRLDPSTLEAVAFQLARKHAAVLAPDAIRAELLGANSTSTRAGAALLDHDAEAAVTRALERAVREPAGEMASALNRDMFGKPEKCLANVVKLLNLPEFTECLAWDTRAQRKVIVSAPCWLSDTGDTYPRAVLDTDYSAIVVYLADRLDYAHATVGQVIAALELAAQATPFDPVVEYLDSLEPFDGDVDDARMVAGAWLSEFAGAPDDEYTRAVAMRWLIAAVARAYRPGCQAREVLTLIGPQNIGKSMLLKTLCGEWFKDDLDLGKDSAQALLGMWIVELAEIDKLVATDRHGALKAFISTGVDNYRRPYGHEFVTVQRCSVFAATANPTQIFRDPTGNTRFNVVDVPGPIDRDGCAEVRGELWSAARMLFKAGEQWWLTESEKVEALVRQEAHRETFDAEEFLRELLEQPFKPGRVEVGAFKVEPGQLDDAKMFMWATSAQLVAYLQSRGINRNVYKQLHQAMTILGWYPERHADRTLNGPRGFRRQ